MNYIRDGCPHGQLVYEMCRGKGPEKLFSTTAFFDREGHGSDGRKPSESALILIKITTLNIEKIRKSFRAFSPSKRLVKASDVGQAFMLAHPDDC